MLTSANIRREVDRLMRERAERTRVSADGVVRELAAVAFARVTDVVDFGPERLELKPLDQIDPGKLSAVHRLSWRRRDGKLISVRMEDKLRALELLGKHLGLFNAEPDGSSEPISLSINLVEADMPPKPPSPSQQASWDASP